VASVDGRFLDEERQLLEDPSLALDESAIHEGWNDGSPSPSSSWHTILIDVVLHPTFGVPCPYIRAWKTEEGSLLSWQDTKELLVHYYENNHANNPRIDSTQISANLIYAQEEHPITGVPSLTLHVCGIEERMRPILAHQQRDAKEAQAVRGGEEDGGSEETLLFIHFFSIVGPYIGFPDTITSSDHLLLSRKLTERYRNSSR